MTFIITVAKYLRKNLMVERFMLTCGFWSFDWTKTPHSTESMEEFMVWRSTPWGSSHLSCRQEAEKSTGIAQNLMLSGPLLSMRAHIQRLHSLQKQCHHLGTNCSNACNCGQPFIPKPQWQFLLNLWETNSYQSKCLKKWGISGVTWNEKDLNGEQNF